MQAEEQEWIPEGLDEPDDRELPTPGEHEPHWLPPGTDLRHGEGRDEGARSDVEHENLFESPPAHSASPLDQQLDDERGARADVQTAPEGARLGEYDALGARLREVSETGASAIDKQQAEIAELRERLAESEDGRVAAEAERHELAAKLRIADTEISRAKLELNAARQETEAIRTELLDPTSQAHGSRIAEPQEQAHRFEQKAWHSTERMTVTGAGGVTDGNGRLDLNTATVESLRGLGLSVTQASRLIARRDAKRGFSSGDELDAVPGIPEHLRRSLRERTFIDPSRRL